MVNLNLVNSDEAKGPDFVDVRPDGERWCVTVVEDGAEVTETFLLETHARSFASGQRIRLGLPAEVA